MLNTLYVDRTLKEAGLIQAYSRTNRVQNMADKPYGHIVNYRWPAHSEELMKRALSLYANRDSAAIQLRMDDDALDGIIEVPYDKLIDEMREVVTTVDGLTDGFTAVPPGESAQMALYHKLNHYNSLMSRIKQDDEYDADTLYQAIGLTPENEVALTGPIATRLKQIFETKDPDDPIHLTLKMAHIKDVRVNYDYLNELLAQLANQIADGDDDGAQKTHAQIQSITATMDDDKYVSQLERFITDLFDRAVTIAAYPVKETDIGTLMQHHTQKSARTEILSFKKKWGLIDIADSGEVNRLIEHHTPEADDLDQNATLSAIIKEAQANYQADAEDETVRSLSKIKYRKHLKQAMAAFADKMKHKY